MKTLLAGLFTLSLAAPASPRAQANPDLSGTWALDEAKSDPAPAVPAGRAGARSDAGAATAGRGGRAGGPPANQLTISQTPTEVTIAQGSQNLTFKFDGTETFYFQNGEIRATAAWNGGTLIVSWKKELFAGPAKGYVTTTGKDSYSVAGNVLTIERTTVAPESAQTRKLVYSKP
jgi:hypothetical protein